jgi:anti-anti-sigma regulatory factor
MLYGGALEDSQEVPIRVVQYVARTQEDVVLSDPASEGPFSGDPYIVRRAPKSLLATPILYQGRSAGVIYLENNLAAGAFTPARVEVLRLLTAQAAISLENAVLYAKLEEKVAQRTAELQLAHSQILALSKEQQQRQEQDLSEKMALIRRQEDLIRALSTPIIEVWEGVLTAPLIGVLNDARAVDLAQSLLSRIVKTRARFAIIDLTGADSVDTNTAGHLLRIIGAVRMLGARSVITGISPAVAQTVTSLGVDLSSVLTYANLREGLKACMTKLV